MPQMDSVWWQAEQSPHHTILQTTFVRFFFSSLSLGTCAKQWVVMESSQPWWIQLHMHGILFCACKSIKACTRSTCARENSH